MKYWLTALMVIMIAPSVYGFSPTVTQTSVPYEVVSTKDNVRQSQEYLGELEGFPVMYELTSDEPFTLQAYVRQKYRPGTDPLPLSLIAIRQNQRGGGVTEIARLTPESAQWQPVKSSALGITLLQSSLLSAQVEPGTYRIEISTPENAGKYLLTFGAEDSDDAYFAQLGGVWRTQQFFGYSFMRMLASSFVYYPLGILLLLFIIQRGWKYRTLVTHNAT